MTSLRQLSYLVALADTQHFGRAAALMRVTQPTLSQQLKELEAQLGVQLAERGKPVQLTPIGRDIAARAREILGSVDEIKKVAARSRDDFAGTIRFGVTPTLGPYLMPAAIVRLRKELPALQLYVREGIPDEQLDGLRRGELDMLLTPLPVSGVGLTIEPLFREPLQLVGAPDHPLFRAAKLSRSNFAGQPILSLDPRHHFHRQAQVICEELGANLLRDYEGTSLDSLRQMAGSNIGLAILPELYLRSETGGEDMVQRFDIANWAPYRSIAAIWREKAALADLYAKVAAIVAEEAAEMLN